MPNIAVILDTLVPVLGVCHAMLDLANAFFSILLAAESLLSLLQGTADFVGTSVRERIGNELTENSRPRNYYKVLGSHWLNKTHVVQEV